MYYVGPAPHPGIFMGITYALKKQYTILSHATVIAFPGCSVPKL